MSFSQLFADDVPWGKNMEKWTGQISRSSGGSKKNQGLHNHPTFPHVERGNHENPGPGPENHAPNLPAAPVIEHGQQQEVRHPPNGGKSAPGMPRQNP